MKEIKSTCCYCGVGCGVLIATDGARITNVRGDPDHPANFGRLCAKGASLHLTNVGRALHPMLRDARGQALRRATWNEALEYTADKFAAIISRHGPDSAAFYISGQLLTEDYYVFNKLARGLVGTNNIDSNSRLCMSSAVAGYKATLGADAPPVSYTDIDHANCVFIAGSNTAHAHPIVFRRVQDAKAKNPRLKIIVVDPRRTETARAADLHLSVLPGTDVALFNGILHVMFWNGWCDSEFISAHTSGFSALKDAVAEYTPKAVAGVCGVPAADIVEAAKCFARGPTLSLYCQGLNQSSHGTANNAALINLHLATGQIGKRGAGPLSLTGQPNAMGGREVGAMANLLSAHRDLANPEHRAEIAKFWGVDAIPASPGKTAVELFRAVAGGEIKALWIACTNPAQSMPNQALVRKALQTAEIVVVQEAFAETETTQYAHVLLPAAAWGEKEGTVTNSERRITRIRSAVPAPGEARPDWWIAAEFARRLSARLGRAQALFPYENAEQIFNEHRETTRGRDLDITGLSYALLAGRGPQQWPFAEGAQGPSETLYADGVFATSDSRARFVSTQHAPVAEPTDVRYPLHLNTGRLRDQWHGMSRTGNVARLFNLAPDPRLSMHADDMHRRGLQEGDLAVIQGRRGRLLIRVQSSDDVRPAQVFLPMHWGGQFMSGSGVNAVTSDKYCPQSKQPELKHAAVQVEKLEVRAQLIALRRFERAGGEHALMRRLRQLFARATFASVGLCGRAAPVVGFLAADEKSLNPALLSAIDREFGLDDDKSMISFRDAKRGVEKRILAAEGKVVALRLTAASLGCDWLQEALAADISIPDLRPWLFSATDAAPAALAERQRRVVCTCHGVDERDIQEFAYGGGDVEALRYELKCGIECGSCLPEVERIFDSACPVKLKAMAAP